MANLETEEPLPGFNLGQHIASFPFTNLELPDMNPAAPTTSKTRSELAYSYDWSSLMDNPEFVAMHVNCFSRVSTF